MYLLSKSCPQQWKAMCMFTFLLHFVLILSLPKNVFWGCISMCLRSPLSSLSWKLTLHAVSHNHFSCIPGIMKKQHAADNSFNLLFVLFFLNILEFLELWFQNFKCELRIWMLSFDVMYLGSPELWCGGVGWSDLCPWRREQNNRADLCWNVLPTLQHLEKADQYDHDPQGNEMDITQIDRVDTIMSRHSTKLSSFK